MAASSRAARSGSHRARCNRRARSTSRLANKIAPYDEQLNAGDVVLAGSFTRSTTAMAGDNFHADDGPLGSVAFRFV